MSALPKQYTIPGSFKLAIVVLNYKTPDLVIDCLQSIHGQIDERFHRVVVVDNYSGDDSADKIENAIDTHSWSEWVSVVRSPVNAGFAAGNNVGINAILADVYLLLNSDTIVREGAIKTLLTTMSEHSDVDMLGPQLEWPDGKPQISTFRYRTPISEMMYAAKLGLLGRLFPKHVVARELSEFEVGLDWVSFACIAIRKKVFDSVGLLDEKYFMYFEDMAMCRKATKAGFKIAYQPDAHVVHLRGGSSPVKEQTIQRKRRPAYYYAARSHYLRSSYGLVGFILGNILWTMGWILSLVRGKSGAVAREQFDIWKSPVHQVPIGGAHG
ncbi:MAG: glycosyltransferase family 2 protein [Phycisphaerales bacterium]|nr:glycosyltransferase family 2 protein [Phycisphaerales bacterium]